MTQGEIAGTLHGTLRRLRESDQAVRRGGSLNVAQGADFWSPAHNHVMYDEGCPWHADGNCSTVDYPSAGAGGVYALALQFQESVESILEMYGGPREEWKDTFGEQRSEGDLATVTYKTVTYNPERAKLLKSSKPVHFVLGGFDGSLFKGYTLVLDVLKKEMNSILQKVHFELRMMYGLYVALLLFGFYAVLFRPTIAGSYWHTERARNFVQMLPTHTLAFAEVQLLKDHFVISQDDL
ncbi:hypothetical protein T484DRAFT_3032599 [Baffinella frigidus]|nr:hypothetical protein T484DRAFT_3032599 [Cryptophyta sp. CCMP2293]|mmetsp:Transcript_33229/g.75995  ORF Transcript_33229/g.75995 Transcript_33229/m.75995 type:complete len:238 (+) Transcript_33229:2-715(+)